jgi:hypothetical protein
MYNAKAQMAEHVHPVAVRVVDGTLVEMPEAFDKAPKTQRRTSISGR